MLRSLGRLVKVNHGGIAVPVEIRKRGVITPGTEVEVYREEGKIVIEKYNPIKCAICGSIEDCKEFGNKHICVDCILDIYQHTALNL